jgi:hypothetical protein
VAVWPSPPEILISSGIADDPENRHKQQCVRAFGPAFGRDLA